MEGLLVMDMRERERLKIIARVAENRMRQRHAAELLKLSVRQIKRLVQAYRREQDAGLVSKRRGKPSNHQLRKDLKTQIITLIREHYLDFGPTFAWEKLVNQHGIDVSVSSVRNVMIQAGIWEPKRTKPKRTHALRERRSCFGELIQMDGSIDYWLEERGPRCSLLVLIDNATGRIVQLRLVASESIEDYFAVTRRYFESQGRPVAFYVDRHSVFCVNQGKQKGLAGTQFGRAMEQLGIKMIFANSPQAKGRVERVNRTLQDRLIKELRLHQISDLEAANAYLPTFLKEYNNHFSVAPRDPIDAHRPLLPEHNLDRIFSLQEERVVTKDLMFQYKNGFYKITEERYHHRLVGAKVTIIESFSGGIAVEFQGKELPCKSLNEWDERSNNKLIKPLINSWKDKKTYHPNKNHPWKRGYNRFKYVQGW